MVKSRNPIRIADALALPLDAVTQKIAWLGRTGSGKTHGCKRFVEQMLRAKAQVVILDGSGAWAGLRLGPRAFDIPVLGGLHGDIPLEPHAGALVADVIVDSKTSMVLDVSLMLDSDRTRFAAAFAERFFFRKKRSPSAVHLVLEECQDFVPENQQRGEERMLHEFQRLSKQGRPHGIGMSFISQRPQEVAKKALNQAECVFAFQMTGPQERRALQHWLTDKGFEGKLADILPTLAVGSPHVWSPQWLKVSKVIRILPIESLDTSRTPKVGERNSKRQALRKIDLRGLSKAMAETIERSKADDPKELKKRIAELEKEIKKKAATPTVERVEVPAIPEHARKHLADAQGYVNDVRAKLDMIFGGIGVALDVCAEAKSKTKRFSPLTAKDIQRTLPPAKGVFLNAKTKKAVETFQQRKPIESGERNQSVGKGGLRRILTVLAQRPNGLTNRQIGIRAGLSSKSGTFANYLSQARKAGWIENQGDVRRITVAGQVALGSYDLLPEGRELLEHWLRELGESGANRILRVLSEAYPNPLSNEVIGERADISPKSGTFANYLSKLRGLELITGGRGAVRMSEELAG